MSASLGRGAVRRFLGTPKGLLILLLAGLVAIAVPVEGGARALAAVSIAVVVAALVDLPILRWRDGTWEFPSGAILTGLIVAMVLSPREPWHVIAITAALAVASKYVIRTRSANVFNPAAIALVATFYLFETAQNWWGALPDLPLAVGLPAVLATGIFITNRVNKTPLVLVFLGSYYALFTATAFAGQSRQVAEIFRPPDLHAVLYFAFFMLTDPPTSPPRYADQIIYGVIVAVASYLVFEWLGAVHYLLAGVLVGNAWEAARRIRAARR